MISIAGLGCAPCVLITVSSSPNLEQLFLDFEGTSQDIPVFASDTFPGLGMLDVTAQVQMCVNLVASLRLVASLQLWDLCLTLNDYSEEDSDATLELAQSIRAVLSPTLTKLELFAPQESFDASIPQPLFECCQLEIVRISIG